MPQSIQITEDSPLLHDANCVYCHVDLDLGDHVVVCERCRSPHHADCWGANQFKCATFGCDGGGTAGFPAPGRQPRQRQRRRRTLVRRQQNRPPRQRGAFFNTVIAFITACAVFLWIAVGGVVALVVSDGINAGDDPIAELIFWAVLGTFVLVGALLLRLFRRVREWMET